MSTEIDEDGHGEVILVVEDNASARIALEAILDALGYRPLMAGSGPEALKIYRENAGTISLVMSDLIMPEMNGPELYEALAKEHGSVRMLIMSGYPLDEQADQLQEKGIRFWIQKPFNMRQLADTVSNALVA